MYLIEGRKKRSAWIARIHLLYAILAIPYFIIIAKNAYQGNRKSLIWHHLFKFLDEHYLKIIFVRQLGQHPFGWFGLEERETPHSLFCQKYQGYIPGSTNGPTRFGVLRPERRQLAQAVDDSRHFIDHQVDFFFRIVNTQAEAN